MVAACVQLAFPRKYVVLFRKVLFAISFLSGYNIKYKNLYNGKAGDGMLALEGYYDGENIQALEEIHAQKNQKLIITILDEFVEEVPKAKSTKTVRGMLAKYADQSLREQEKSAWEKPVVEKYGNA